MLHSTSDLKSKQARPFSNFESYQCFGVYLALSVCWVLEKWWYIKSGIIIGCRIRFLFIKKLVRWRLCFFWKLLVSKKQQKLNFDNISENKFCLTVPKNFGNEPLCVFESFCHRKTSCISGVTTFSVRSILSNSNKKFQRRDLSGFAGTCFWKAKTAPPCFRLMCRENIRGEKEKNSRELENIFRKGIRQGTSRMSNSFHKTSTENQW